MTKPSEIASGAIAVIELYGWTRTVYGSNDCGYCTVGSVYRAGGKLNPEGDLERFETTPEECAVLNELRELIVDKHIAAWNDKLGRSKDDVLEVLEQTRDRLIAKGI